MEGTYPLPEAQLDRFLFKILVPFPGPRDIETILERTTEAKEPSVTAIFEGAQCLEMGQLAREIPIAQEVRRYGVQVVMATHPDQASATEKVKRYVRFGSSPRGAQAVILAAKIRAILDGRYNVSREDIQRVAKPALRHRIILNFEGQAENISPDEIIDDIVASTPVAPEAQAG
jgi:MoxR-like ATPase